MKVINKPSFLLLNIRTNQTMKASQVCLAFISLSFLSTFSVGSSHFTDDIVSISCGSTGTSSSYTGRKWFGDIQQRSSQLLQLTGSSTTSTASSTPTSAADPALYKTARLSRSQFSYTLKVNPGQIIIRLHFNPTSYRGFKGLKDLFTVEAGSFTLLSNFSASLAANALRLNFLTKEFCLNILENQLLHITFSAETKDVYAFINGIEIISVPASLSYFQGGDIGLQVVGRNSPINVDNSVALEIIYRQNTKQELLSSAHDSDENFGMTWKICVDVGFRYLIRLHFSKLGFKMAQTGALKFNLFINEMIADTNTDIVVKERYGDYIVTMNGQKREGNRDLLIRMQFSEEFMDGPLKGFEILKLSNPDNSLASPIPMPPSQDSTSQTFEILLKILGYRNAISTVVITVISFVSISVHKLRETWEATSTGEARRISARAERLCRRFSLREIQLATRNFSDGLVIGKGGFGKVYRGLIDKGKNTVAIKRLKSNSSQGAREFLMEIETLSELRHINLVSLIGYCSEGREMILVYEYMACGTLADHLYNLARKGIVSSSLTWKQRLNICIGAARGLDYLHTGHRLIHRDVKTSNILLDEKFIAKVSDFGLAKAEDRSKSQSHVSTKVKGTHGYLDPYYYSTRKLTRKSDTYALGVVLLEVLCGRPAIDQGALEDEHILTTWARDKISKGEVGQIVASSLSDKISPKSLKTFVGIAERCLHEEPKNRPTMSQVVLQLEFALEQQNETPSFPDEIHPSDRTTHLASPGQSPVNSINLQIPNKVVSADFISGRRKHRGKSTRNKPLRVWPWNAFLNRAKPSNKYESFISGIESWAAEIKLPKFDRDQIAAATNYFSPSNIVGTGKFTATVYKAVLSSGEVVAVKNRSLCEVEDLMDFQYEITALPNLQHQNIIKLLGYCTGWEELLLVFEFMENTSIDNFIGQQRHLEWGVRYQIIMGIARGLVYLHHESGLKVIHRDLKLSSILLDLNMNPKISGFYLAKSTVENQSELEMSRQLATYDYMPPEYWTYGKFSVKSDVYSFGIILLEIVSGRRVSAINLEHGSPAKHVWKLWNERRAIDLVDESLQESAFDEAVRCIQVALLCIQDHPDHRPSMPSVIKILEGNDQIQVPEGVNDTVQTGALQERRRKRPVVEA